MKILLKIFKFISNILSQLIDIFLTPDPIQKAKDKDRIRYGRNYWSL